MDGPDRALTDGQLDGLLLRYRELVAQRDPVPGPVLDGAVLAFGWRDPDAELAELVADSLVPERLAAVRGGNGIRLLTFDASGVVIELQVSRPRDDMAGHLRSPALPQRQLEGHVAGAGAGFTASLQHRGGDLAVEPDEHGRFQLDALPAGPLRLRLHTAGRAITTTWLDL
ncbi:MAG: hypothetical protein ABI807_08205 [Sporichthyaceae bacterium]